MDEVDGPTDKRTLKASLSLFHEVPNVQLKPKPQIWLTPQQVLDYFLRLSTEWIPFHLDMPNKHIVHKSSAAAQDRCYLPF